MHLHAARTLLGWGLGILALSPLALSVVSWNSRTEHSSVTGQVKYSGRPVEDMIICFDSGGTHSACGALGSDGSFQLCTVVRGDERVLPGKYHAHLFHVRGQSPSIPSRYADPLSSGLEVEIASNWNHLNIELP
jgi:hypothetical protein